MRRSTLLPGRHLRPPQSAPVSQGSLADKRDHLASTLAALDRLLPEVPSLGVPDEEVFREVSLEELAQTGAVFIRRATPRSAEDEKDLSGLRVEGRILTGQDIARTVPPSGIGEVIPDEVRNPTIREGDVLVPLVAGDSPRGWPRAGTWELTCRRRST